VRQQPLVPPQAWPETFDSCLDASGTCTNPLAATTRAACNGVDNPVTVGVNEAGVFTSTAAYATITPVFTATTCGGAGGHYDPGGLEVPGYKCYTIGGWDNNWEQGEAACLDSKGTCSNPNTVTSGAACTGVDRVFTSTAIYQKKYDCAAAVAFTCDGVLHAGTEQACLDGKGTCTNPLAATTRAACTTGFASSAVYAAVTPVYTGTTCYRGDLAGKFGAARTGAKVSYVDATQTLDELLGKSVVIHAAGGTARIACGKVNAGPVPLHAALTGSGFCGSVAFTEGVSAPARMRLPCKTLR